MVVISSPLAILQQNAPRVQKQIPREQPRSHGIGHRMGVDRLMQSWVWAITLASLRTLYHDGIDVGAQVILISSDIWERATIPLTNQLCFQAMNIFSPSLRAFGFAFSGLHKCQGRDDLKYKRTLSAQALTCWESFNYTPPALEKL